MLENSQQMLFIFNSNDNYILFAVLEIKSNELWGRYLPLISKGTNIKVNNEIIA